MPAHLKYDTGNARGTTVPRIASRCTEPGKMYV